jgi:large subunit ribosomal protein L15
MIQLHKLSKIKAKSKRRIGRGHGSGRVKTAGKGTKGQRSRGNISTRMGIAGVSFAKRLPLYRGKYRNKSHKSKIFPINLKYLVNLPKNTVVDIACLIKHNIISKDNADVAGIKILGSGEMKEALTIKLPISKSAAKKILKAGGTIEN